MQYFSGRNWPIRVLKLAAPLGPTLKQLKAEVKE